jgi:hypothetical protein
LFSGGEDSVDVFSEFSELLSDFLLSAKYASSETTSVI